MALGKLWTIAWRDLGRNRRRTFFSLLAVALGLTLLIAINSLVAGVMEESLQTNIRLQTGHVQVRAASYVEEKSSLKWEDLLQDADAVAAQARGLPGVQAAAPVLWASGVINTPDDSAGVRVYGVDTDSAVFDPVRNGVTSGAFLTADDRSGVILGQRLAESLKLNVGDNVSLTVIDADGQPQEAIFTLRGIFTTGAVTYDSSTAFLPIAKAQALTNTAGRASSVIVLTNSQDEVQPVAAALRSPGVQTLTWQDLNRLYIDSLELVNTYYGVLDFIIILIVAVILANTLLMAVFERIREVGILAALGMKRGQIRQMFLIEAALLGLGGIALGLIFGTAIVYYLATVGIYIGADSAKAAENFALGTTMHARFVPVTMAWLSLATLVITVLAALYPAWFASRLEPVEALHNA